MTVSGVVQNILNYSGFAITVGTGLPMIYHWNCPSTHVKALRAELEEISQIMERAQKDQTVIKHKEFNEANDRRILLIQRCAYLEEAVSAANCFTLFTRFWVSSGDLYCERSEIKFHLGEVKETVKQTTRSRDKEVRSVLRILKTTLEQLDQIPLPKISVSVEPQTLAQTTEAETLEALAAPTPISIQESDEQIEPSLQSTEEPSHPNDPPSQSHEVPSTGPVQSSEPPSQPNVETRPLLSIIEICDPSAILHNGEDGQVDTPSSASGMPGHYPTQDGSNTSQDLPSSMEAMV